MKTKRQVRLIFIGLISFILLSINSSAQNPWSQGTDMTTARNGHTVATANGMIYAIGGNSGKGSSNILEEYNPINNTWETKTSMPTSRLDFSGCGLNDKIYAIGGWRSINITFSKIEEYDPATDTWTTKTPMPSSRWGHTTCSLDGKIYVIGGAKGWPIEIIYETIEVYDPITDTWETKASIPTPRWMPSSSVINGKIYVVGGIGEWGVVPMMEVYDPITDIWSTKTPMPTARWGLATGTANGKIYAIGGADIFPPTISYRTVEEYDPITNTWTTKSPMPAGRNRIAACTVNGKIYVPGGGGLQASDAYSELYIYNPENETGIDNILVLNFQNNYPNPFTISTNFKYELKQPEKVTLSIYNHLGQLIYQIQETQTHGKQHLIWNAEGYTNGIYFYKLQVGKTVINGKIVKV